MHRTRSFLFAFACLTACGSPPKTASVRQTPTDTPPLPTAAPSASASDPTHENYKIRHTYAAKLKYAKSLGACSQRSSSAKVTDTRIEVDGVIDFERDSDRLTEGSTPALEALKQALVDNPKLDRVEVAGHADSSGEDAHNLDLTRRRAKAVEGWLVRNGIASDRLVSMGYSSYCPRIVDDTKNAKNRRVELVIVRRDRKPVEPGWGGCEAAQKKGLNKPTPVAAASPGTKQGASPTSLPGTKATAAPTWTMGQKLPDKLCGEPWPAEQVSSEMFVPLYEMSSPYFTAPTSSAAAEHVRGFLAVACEGEDKHVSPAIVRIRLASWLLTYGAQQTDKALREDAIGHAMTLVKRQRQRPTGGKYEKVVAEECKVEAEVSIRQGNLDFVKPLADCLAQSSSNTTVIGPLLWFALDVAEQKKAKLDVSSLLRYSMTTGQPLVFDRTIRARIKVLDGATQESTLDLWTEAVREMECRDDSGRWLLGVAPEVDAP